MIRWPISRLKGETVDIDVSKGEKQALVAAVRELKTYENKIKFFTNVVSGADMNVNVGFSGTPEEIHQAGAQGF